MKQHIIVTLINTSADVIGIVLVFLAFIWRYMFISGIRNGLIKMNEIESNDIGLQTIYHRNSLVSMLSLFTVFFSYNVTKIIDGFPAFITITAEVTSIITSCFVIINAQAKYKIFKSL